MIYNRKKLNFYEKKDEIRDVENSKINFCKNIVKPTADELKEHKNFLNRSLKKNYF